MDQRRLHGAILIAGAAGFYAILGLADVGFHWTPIVIGLVYLVAAFARHRRCRALTRGQEDWTNVQLSNAPPAG